MEILVAELREKVAALGGAEAVHDVQALEGILAVEEPTVVHLAQIPLDVHPRERGAAVTQQSQPHAVAAAATLQPADRAQLVGEPPVDLLGHRVVERAEPGLDVGQRHAELRPGQCGAARGLS